jgi:hypothetical protein
MRQQREMRGKAEPHGAQPATDATGSIAKTQALLEAIQRVDQELSRREEIETRKAGARPNSRARPSSSR